MFLMTEGLGKRYGKHWAVSGVNLQVEKGDILVYWVLMGQERVLLYGF